MKNSLNSTVGKTANPFKHLWDQYIQGSITLQDLQQETRRWMLNRVSSYAYQGMPPPLCYSFFLCEFFQNCSYSRKRRFFCPVAYLVTASSLDLSDASI